MDEQRIWAPWRIGYVAGDELARPSSQPTHWQADADRACFLCQAAAVGDDFDQRRGRHVVAATETMVVVLNRFPYANGHLLISPLRHVADLAELTAEERADSLAQLTRFTQLLRETIRASGFNIGLNLGEVAGAGVPGHLHWHLVPRWPGDANFMPVTAGVRVISQSLDALWDALEQRLNGGP